MPTTRGKAMTDTISDVSGARTGVGPVVRRTPREVRDAQRAFATTAWDHPELVDYDQAKDALTEVLDALGIRNREGKIDEPYQGEKRKPERPRGYREPGKREPSGRLSRAAAKKRIEEVR